jgi:hypothetical protein
MVSIDTMPVNDQITNIALSKEKFYTTLRHDRSGSAILDMLAAHAYAFAHGKIYGGACGPPNHSRRHIHQRLVKSLGLELVLPFACPSDSSEVTFQMNSTEYGHRLYLSPDWLNEIQSHVTYPSRSDHDVFHVALHVRRGDVTPCHETLGMLDRYTPNQSYLRFIQEYAPRDRQYQVTVFSETKSFEPWDDFLRRNFTLELDTDLASVWRSMIVADMLVMSVSTFSYVAALLNRHGLIVYTGCDWLPFPHWKQINQTLFAQRKHETLELRRTQCLQLTGM